MAPADSPIPDERGDSSHTGIEELGAEGDGIGYVVDFLIIVPESTLGESVTVEVERIEEQYAVATPVDPAET